MSEAQLPWHIEYALRKAALTAKGQLDGINFALEAQGTPNRIQAEIESRELTLHAMLASTSFGDSNPMTPGASPRIYMDAYIAGLREALALIQEMSGAEPT